MSIDGETSRVMKGVQHGACDYLLKPVRMKELRNIWQHVYRKKMHEVKEIEGHEFTCDDLQLILETGFEGFEERGLLTREDKKRKEEHSDQDGSDQNAVKKARVVWSVDLHQKFVNAVNQIGFDSEYYFFLFYEDFTCTLIICKLRGLTWHCSSARISKNEVLAFGHSKHYYLTDLTNTVRVSTALVFAYLCKQE